MEQGRAKMTHEVASSDARPFLGDLSVLDLKTEYRSLKEDPVREFYRPCLLNAISYKRAVGYFRSTVYNVIGTSIVEFARRGGRTELICSPELSQEDIDSIALGYARKSDLVGDRLSQQIEYLLAAEETAFNTRVLATLVSVGALEIKVAVRADRKGLYHEKIGVFSDGIGNAVSFKGSANETWSGWHQQGNFESVEVFCSWRGGLEAERVKKHTAHFDMLWAEHDPDIEVFSFPAEAVAHLKKAAFEDLDAVGPKDIPSSEKRRKPLPHQDAAVSAWLSRGGRGIFDHATGSGKTFTALMAIRRHIERGNPALVVVPSRLLLDQWASEIKDELPEAALLLAGGGNNAWRVPHRLNGMTGYDTAHGGRIVLATMQTASMDAFRDAVIDGDHLLLVADEVHQIGSPQHARIMTLNTGCRLGLSATPVRYGDPDGTRQIFDYFGEVVPPPITLADAIEAGRLVPYEYYPHALNLTAEEAEEWRTYTDRIRREIARQKPKDASVRPLSDKAKMLLIQRSRIAKKAATKVRLACDVLKAHFKKGQSWLVYCEDADQLGQVLATLRQEGMNPVEYHSNMEGDRAATMSWFRSFGGILVSIRCLDEGVDIPDVSHALVLASSQNPRQFIQRRGRVLRRVPDKHLAILHDTIVTPVSADDEPEQISLLKSELVRAIEFADHAINKGAGAELRDIAIGMGIEPDGLFDNGVEEDEEEA
jgi:superfamily II DNA or RNA helicase